MFLLPVHLRSKSNLERRNADSETEDDGPDGKFYIFDQNNQIYAAKPILGQSITAPVLDPVKQTDDQPEMFRLTKGSLLDVTNAS